MERCRVFGLRLPPAPRPERKRCQPRSPPATALQDAGALTSTPGISARFWSAVGEGVWAHTALDAEEPSFGILSSRVRLGFEALGSGIRAALRASQGGFKKTERRFATGFGATTSLWDPQAD